MKSPELIQQAYDLIYLSAHALATTKAEDSGDFRRITMKKLQLSVLAWVLDHQTEPVRQFQGYLDDLSVILRPEPSGQLPS